MLSTEETTESETPSESETSSNNTSDIEISQYAAEVLDCSSQFGLDTSISYTSQNILGRPSQYPSHGDFPETFAFRTYGPWWRDLSSCPAEFQAQNQPTLVADDFIVLQFEQCVFPEHIWIYETYNPGAVIRIWAYTVIDQWSLLYEADAAEWISERHSARARKFQPNIKRISLPTRILKIEFKHSKLNYFTEIDAVEMVGKKYVNPHRVKQFPTKRQFKGPIQKKLELQMVRFKPRDDQDKAIQEFFRYDFNRFVQEAGLDRPNREDFQENSSSEAKELTLNTLPYEVLFKILSMLDLRSLFRIAQVDRTLFDVATDPLLYTEINLKPYWPVTNNVLLRSLSKRIRFLRKLDLSWCGLFSCISGSQFRDFIKERGSSLTHLRLDSCKFLNDLCLNTISMVCHNLKELSLRNYSMDGQDFYPLAQLRHLERLDLFRACIETEPLCQILSSNRHLKHLNVGLSSLLLNMDEIAIQIAQTNKEMISLDFWKSQSLTNQGLRALAECHDLEEVDFGWCLREETPPTESLLAFLKSCPRLKKLFLTAVRGLTDRDLDNIGVYCPNLQQLDLMGIFGISTDAVERLLSKCKRLKLLDLSFCNQIDEIRIVLWRSIFDASIKRDLSHIDPFPF
ncbi:F-box/LRR-repeat protein 4 [Culicoides brevitarsis]|uniref:F-box/LRR-repeat protein 4 n=1 Tax=Culicoides brevitarsis TaxID=469753 RepID=UPI00307CA8D2